MKKTVLFILIIILSQANSTFSYAEEVNIVIPHFDIRVNEQAIDVEHSQYPVFTYKDITYFPMTYDYLDGIGMELYILYCCIKT
jgi:hypothetical protein